jgi:hypothetical protein
VIRCAEIAAVCATAPAGSLTFTWLLNNHELTGWL